MQLGDKKLIVQRASVGKADEAPQVNANAPVTLQVSSFRCVGILTMERTTLIGARSAPSHSWDARHRGAVPDEYGDGAGVD